jgi:K+-transporting ATPase KdpF subunit
MSRDGGFGLLSGRVGLLLGLPGDVQALREPGAAAGVNVNATYLIAGVVALLLLGYLVASLLKPEWFG